MWPFRRNPPQCILLKLVRRVADARSREESLMRELVDAIYLMSAEEIETLEEACHKAMLRSMRGERHE